MSAVTRAELDRRLRLLAAALDAPPAPRLVGTCTRAYADQLVEAPRCIVVVHLLVTAARVAWSGVAAFARTWAPKADVRRGAPQSCRCGHEDFMHAGWTAGPCIGCDCTWFDLAVAG